ncbi:helix-turn-helix domain-containing protein [Capnocytophaga sp. ARDL2]|uniref:helix-turn-helix domain-containing protein n=1 Tax=Capnocytophaga sp. ARDL2 TaxID=3238809 RepID=UPI003557B839
MNIYYFWFKNTLSAFSDLIKSIKERRKVLNITQEDLAEIAGVGLRTLRQFESGKGNPTLQTLEKICTTLGLEIKFEMKR